MKICKRIITSFVVLVTCFSLCTTSVLAAWQNELGYWYVNSNFAQWAAGGILSYAGSALGGMAGTIVLPGGGTIEGTALGATAGAAASAGIYDLASYYAAGYTDDDYYTAEDSYVSTLDSTAASAIVQLSSYRALTMESTRYYSFLSDPQKVEFPFFSFLKKCGVYEYTMILGGHSNHLYGFYFDETGVLYVGKFVNPFDSMNGSYCTMYDISSLELSASYMCTCGGAPVYYSKSYAENSEDFLTKSCYFIDWASCGETLGSVLQYEFYAFLYCKSDSNMVFDSSSQRAVVRFGYDAVSGDFTRLNSMYCCTSFTYEDDFVVNSPVGAGVESRTASLMQTINNYNIDNSYTDNSTTVNYFIGSMTNDGSVTDVYSPLLYDEETLIFTEPVTGAQYQTTGWTYDYTTRTYTLDLEAGTYVVDGTDVATIEIEYGDDAVNIDYYSADATVLVSDEFAYVMVSQSACNINGHTNTVEITKEPTCTAAGERTYTCSVCGNQTVEEIPKIDHTYADYSIQQEPTCTNKGIAANTCLTCGSQITELLGPLGHDWLPTSITDESWAMPDGVSCPDCYGTSFSHTRSDYEIVTGGKNLFDVSQIKYGVVIEGSGVGFPISAVSKRIYSCVLLNLPVKANTSYTISYDNTGVWISRVCEMGYDGVCIDNYPWYAHGDQGSPVTITTDPGVCYLSINFRLRDTTATMTEDIMKSINVQVEEGSVATEYEPYISKEVEIIPPIYNFTCNDCSTEWTAEAIYQHAFTTFTCSRCDETMIQSEEPPMEEQDWFLDFGDVIKSFTKKVWSVIGSGIDKLFSGFADLLGGFFGFLSDTLLGGVKAFFASFSDDSVIGFFRQKNSDGSTSTTLPEGVASTMTAVSGLFTGLPAELRGVLGFGIAMLFLIAAFKLVL